MKSFLYNSFLKLSWLCSQKGEISEEKRSRRIVCWTHPALTQWGSWGPWCLSHEVRPYWLIKECEVASHPGMFTVASGLQKLHFLCLQRLFSSLSKAHAINRANLSVWFSFHWSKDTCCWLNFRENTYLVSDSLRLNQQSNIQYEKTYIWSKVPSSFFVWKLTATHYP